MVGLQVTCEVSTAFKRDAAMRSKPFTSITAILLLILALFHVSRLMKNFPILVGTQPTPMWVSIAHVAILGLLSWGLFREARRLKAAVKGRLCRQSRPRPW